jgi:hypothetical protein
MESHLGNSALALCCLSIVLQFRTCGGNLLAPANTAHMTVTSFHHLMFSSTQILVPTSTTVWSDRISKYTGI